MTPKERLLQLDDIVAPDPQVSGRIAVLDVARDLPFAVQRVYWIHSMRQGEVRGGHGHRRLQQAVIAVAGRVSFELDDGTTRRRHLLDRPGQVLIVPAGEWRDFTALDDGATLLVLASEPYDADDYIRDYQVFLDWARDRLGGAS